MLFASHKATQRSVRIERWNLPRIHVHYNTIDRNFHHSPYDLGDYDEIRRVTHIIFDPFVCLFALDRWHGFLVLLFRDIVSSALCKSGHNAVVLALLSASALHLFGLEVAHSIVFIDWELR